MKIGAITYEHFSKNWTSQQADSSVQRNMQPSRVVKGDYFTRSRNSERSKRTDQTLPESKRSIRSNKESSKINFNGLKTAWTNKEIPLVTRGYYGDRLTFDNVGIKTINGCQVLVGNKKKGHVTDKDIVDYFMQFVRYPNYRRYILDNIDRVE